MSFDGNKNSSDESSGGGETGTNRCDGEGILLSEWVDEGSDGGVCCDRSAFIHTLLLFPNLHSHS